MCTIRVLALVTAVGFFPLGHLCAHPGHSHHDDFREVIPAQPVSTGPSSALLAACGLVVAAPMGWLLQRKLARPVHPLAWASFAGMALAVFGCSHAVTAEGSDDRVQPKHDVKRLEAVFTAFKADGVTVRADDDFLYVESNAFPSHPMMVGIKAWQQQVPLPQPYTGKNAWRIPLKPVVAAKPISAKKALYRGAIALAVNGVPIFNALNNRGEDAYLAGELDEHGGHCGRGDDYHYHIAPVHLEKTVGKGKPIAYALDGFPIYGYTDDNGNEPTGLDEFHGRFEADGTYRYYASKTYPYINGGLRGVVTVRGDQIEPQPKDAPVRPAGEPLRGATVTAFTRDNTKKEYTLTYDLRGQSRTIRYTIGDNGRYTFVTQDGLGAERTETFRRRDR